MEHLSEPEDIDKQDRNDFSTRDQQLLCNSTDTEYSVCTTLKAHRVEFVHQYPVCNNSETSRGGPPLG